MRKILKMLSAVLVTAIVAAVISVSVTAAEPASISVKTAPTRTVYYEGVDTFDGMLICDPSGMVITVTNTDGTTFDVSADEYELIFMEVENYVLGENTATITYVDEKNDELTTTVTITVEESPVADVKITQMPDKTEYDMDKDVLTRENFSFDKLYSVIPEEFDAIMEENGITYEELKAAYDDPEQSELLKDIIFDEYESILMIDTAGMEIEVTFKDGTKQTLTDEQDCAVYNGTEIPIMVGQYKDITEGENTLYVDAAGVKADFTVTVKKNTVVTPEKPVTKPGKPVDNKNPEIPNTDGGVSFAAAAVIALVSGCGMALVPSKKKEQY